MEVGSPVTYVDQFAKPHAAVVTAVHGAGLTGPSINLVYVSPDPTETDSYGRQIKRETSVVHAENQAAHGRYWHI